jgi:hypothetical protein
MFLNYIKEFSVKNKIKQFTKCKKQFVLRNNRDCRLNHRPTLFLRNKSNKGVNCSWYFTGEHRGHCLPGYV